MSQDHVSCEQLLLQLYVTVLPSCPGDAQVPLGTLGLGGQMNGGWSGGECTEVSLHE